ncbi:DNA adenine methylase [Spirochaetia bacterium 38H-sp]|uniref:site-specific DNA-methyltransferase (adenine-specific) n=1 Tax=Rarispira pelagica TaxID=3141764 RepID=A0ABU9UCP7_9SPIR
MKTLPSTFLTGIKNEPYLNTQLIAYIGNKRSLLPFLAKIISHYARETDAHSFIDFFAGTGAVSRLAKKMGFVVHANDWEFYSYLANKAYLEINTRELPYLFAEKGGVKNAIDTINHIAEKKTPAEPYISRHYAPASMEADYRTERMFYTPRNARFIDTAREIIEEWYPGWTLSEEQKKEKSLLISLLNYQAAKHANTSGVFKAFHKGFGGHGKDALSRILAPIKLPYPVLADSPYPAYTYCQDAEKLAEKISADICYIDPPYTIHQYGSNYFMLNTIAKWDKPEVPEEKKEDGTLKVRAGIREDWKETRSDYCSRKKAEEAMERLIEKTEARTILISYNTDGIIHYKKMLDILGRHGKTEIHLTPYVKYRGGKQSINRKTHTTEYICVLRKGRKSISTPDAIEKYILMREIRELLSAGYNPQLIGRFFDTQEDKVTLHPSLPPIRTKSFHLFLEEPDDLSCLSIKQLKTIKSNLQICICQDREEELYHIIDILKKETKKTEITKYTRRAAWLLKKFAFKKYKTQFKNAVKHIENLIKTKPDKFSKLSIMLKEIKITAEKRFKG